MTTVKKVLAFLKTYWYIPVIIVVAVAFILLGKSNFALSLFRGLRKDYSKEIEKINQLDEQKNKEKEELQKKYLETVAQLESKYIAEGKELEENKKKVVKKLVDKYKNDPDALTEQLAKEFNLVVE